MRRSGAGFSLPAAVVVNHVNARARGLFLTFPAAAVFFRPDISHRWIIPDAVRQIIARSLFPGRIVGGNRNPLKNDLLSAARVYTRVSHVPPLVSSHDLRTPTRWTGGGGATRRYRSDGAFLLKKKKHFYSFLPRCELYTHVRKPDPHRSPSSPYICAVQRPPEPDRIHSHRLSIFLVTDSSLPWNRVVWVRGSAIADKTSSWTNRPAPLEIEFTDLFFSLVLWILYCYIHDAVDTHSTHSN